MQSAFFSRLRQKNHVVSPCKNCKFLFLPLSPSRVLHYVHYHQQNCGRLIICTGPNVAMVLPTKCV